VNQQEFFETVLQALEKLEIPYMVAGSVAAVVYGQPRMTNDIDVIVDLSPGSAGTLARCFPPRDFYFPPQATVLEEIRRHGQFNVIHVASGSKADLILRKDTPHGASEFPRRRLQPMTPGLDAYVASPEDVIIAKLTAYAEGRSEKHLTDIAGIVSTQGEALDLEYIAAWVGKLGLGEAWRASRTRSGSR
jgi:hypothetical protein